MRPLLAIAILLLSVPAYTNSVATRTGRLTLPSSFTHQAFNGTDSSPGTVKRDDDKFVIKYDIGAMSGTAMHPGRRAECQWFIEHEVDGHRAYTGLVAEEGKRSIITTIFGNPSDVTALPANFRAEVQTERDIADFMLIATSYRPKSAP